MPRESTARTTVDALVIGGGATGAGLLRDLSGAASRRCSSRSADLGTGTSGRYHGLLHSGGRYVVTDPAPLASAPSRTAIVRRIAPACVEDTGGFFVATPEDPDDFGDGFAAACAASGVPVDEVSTAGAARPRAGAQPGTEARVPRPGRGRRAVAADRGERRRRPVPGRRRAGRTTGSSAMRRSGARILAVDVADERTGTVTHVHPRIVVSAAGAWAGRVAALAGADLAMSPGKGTMLIFNQRMTDTVVEPAQATGRRRHHGPGPLRGDPRARPRRRSTTRIVYGIRREEVAALLAEGEKLFPDLPRMRLLRAYAGVPAALPRGQPRPVRHGRRLTTAGRSRGPTS